MPHKGMVKKIDPNLKIAVLGIKMGLVAIAITIASLILSLNYASSSAGVKILVNLVLIVLALIVFWMTSKIKVPK